MKKTQLHIIILSAAISLFITSCADKLDLYPVNDLTPEKAYSTTDGVNAVLAKIYGTLAITGNTGPAGAPDIAGGLDEGSQVAFIRGFFNMQELPTDEAIVSWNDQTIHDFHALKWTPADPFILGAYARPIYNITLINEYLRETTADKLSQRGFSGNDVTNILKTRDEVRFLRAFNYWIMMDLFGRSTFITENDNVGKNLPKEIQRADLFNYIESELLAIESQMGSPRSMPYGRVDQAAAWGLLARLYLNAEVYTGAPKYTEAITFSKKVIDAGYTLSDNYSTLFMADNDRHTNELIFVANCDGLRTKAFGNTTFLVHAACGDDYVDYGTNTGWAGYRATKALRDKFADFSGDTDQRALFSTSVFLPTDAQVDIDDVGNFSNGLHVKKYVNIRWDGGTVSDPTKEFSDIDFPIIRLAEMYLIYAEAVLRGGTGGSTNEALEYLNKLRYRAYGNSYGPDEVGKVNMTDLTVDFILDERARELYWEGHRRTDLIRYDKLTTGSYLWPWKGGVKSGTGVDAKYNLYPIPNNNRSSNPNLTQNPGY